MPAARVGRLYPCVVIATVGAVVLLVLLLVRRKMAGKPAVHISGKAVGAVLLGIVGALVLGVGMCMAMVWGMLVPGIVMGVAGILFHLQTAGPCPGEHHHGHLFPPDRPGR